MIWLRRIVASLALAGAPAAAEPWREASSAHFVIYSQEDAASLEAFATRLERFDKAMRVVRNLGDPPGGAANRLTVFVVRDTGSVRRLLGEGPASAAGFYHAQAGGSMAFTPRIIGGGSKMDMSAQIVLLHEYAHHFMWRHFPAAYPAWFVEGFAEFNSTARFEKDGGVGLGLPAQHRAYDLVGGPAALPLAAMLGEERAKLNDGELQNLYSRGWLLTHYLTLGGKREGQLGAYLKAINDGTPAAKAATDAFGPLKLLDRELHTYLQSARMRYMPIKPEALPIAPVSIRTLRPGEAAIMPVVMRSRRGVDRKTAPQVAVEARAAAAPFPNDPFVQAALAEAEYDVDDLDAAEKAADRAIAADPKSSRGLLYKGRVALARASKVQGAERIALVKAARTRITAANRLDPDDPVPLILFYRTFALLGQQASANAVIGLTVAHQLAPEDSGLRIMLARQFVMDRRLAEVRSLLNPLVNAPHGGESRETARAILAALPPAATETATAAKP